LYGLVAKFTLFTRIPVGLIRELTFTGRAAYSEASDAAMHEVNLVIVQAFSNEAEAEIAKGALEAAGIDAMIQADSVGGMRPHVAWAGGGFKILVREEDEESARKILGEH
jgi:hypothetical protein